MALYNKAGAVKYEMKESTAKAILKTRTDGDKKMNPQAFLVNYVNENCGLLHNCTEVIVSLD